jgi:hypothetical protein
MTTNAHLSPAELPDDLPAEITDDMLDEVSGGAGNVTINFTS